MTASAYLTPPFYDLNDTQSDDEPSPPHAPPPPPPAPPPPPPAPPSQPRMPPQRRRKMARRQGPEDESNWSGWASGETELAAVQRAGRWLDGKPLGRGHGQPYLQPQVLAPLL